MTAEQVLIKRWRDLADRYERACYEDSYIVAEARIFRLCADELSDVLKAGRKKAGRKR